MNNKIWIIIINWNDYINTKECIESLLLNNDNNLFDIILVDNNSKDWSKEKLIKEFTLKNIIPSNFNCEQNDVLIKDYSFYNPDLWNICISLNDNYWFTWANNFGLKYLYQNWYKKYLLLNNDTIISKNFIINIIETSNKFPNNLISCKINYFDNPNIIWNMWTYIDKYGTPQWYNYNKIDTLDYKKYKKTELASCCLLLIPNNILEKTWWQDNNYFFNIDDSDYTYWAYKLWYWSIINTNISILHKSAMSVKDKPNISTYYFYRNLVYFRKKYFTLLENILPYIYITYKIFKSFIVALILNKRWLFVYKELLLDIYYNKMWKKEMIEKKK